MIDLEISSKSSSPFSTRCSHWNQEKRKSAPILTNANNSRKYWHNSNRAEHLRFSLCFSAYCKTSSCLVVGRKILLLTFRRKRGGTAWIVSKYVVISGQYFPVFIPNIGKYRPEITPYLDTSRNGVAVDPLSNRTKFSKSPEWFDIFSSYSDLKSKCFLATFRHTQD